MTDVYRRLIQLYPEDVRFAYAQEMIDDFDRELSDARKHGTAKVAAYVFRRLLQLFGDAGAERINSLYSHRTFHGRCEPHPGVVRPPNMSKREWFGSIAYRDRLDDPS
jgi:hypothetical protein